MQNGTDEPICKAEIETQLLRTSVWTPSGERGGGVNWETAIDIYNVHAMYKIVN